MNTTTNDITIIGGGIMGLFTAYYSSLAGASVAVLEKSTLLNPLSSSNGLTRSIRQDYLDPFYANLAYQAYELWTDLQTQFPQKFVINCGCLNISSNKFIPNPKSSYAYKSYQVLKSLSLPSLSLTGSSLAARFPQFQADYASLNTSAGLIYTPPLYKFLMEKLKEKNVSFFENVNITSITSNQVKTDLRTFASQSVIMTPGQALNDLLSKVKNTRLKSVPLSLSKPIENKYLIPRRKSQFNYKSFPVFAFLDVGIYGHPIVTSLTPGVKIGCYNPFSSPQNMASIDSFIATCLPQLKSAKSKSVYPYDQCYYDLTPDKDFILGPLPDQESLFVGSGWCGTGYKFAPLVGKILSQLALNSTSSFDISRFNPGRFL